ERFPGIRDFREESKTFAKKNGYVLTLFGRKCHYPDIVDSNPSIRAFNERAAVNARDRKSTRLNSSHLVTSYAVFCLKKTTPPPWPTAPRWRCGPGPAAGHRSC